MNSRLLHLQTIIASDTMDSKHINGNKKKNKNNKDMKGKNATAFIAIAVVVVIIAIACIALLTMKNANAGGAYFNGHTYLLINTSFTGNFTFVAWVYYKSFNGTGVVASQGIGEGTHSTWYFGTGGEIPNRTMCGVFSDERVQGNYTAGWRFTTAPFIGTGSWHMVACVYNKTSISMYINGTLVNTTATPYNVYGQKIIEIGKRTSTFYLNGNEPTFAYFNGYLENTEFYNTPLGSKSISMLYSRGISGEPFSNVSLYIPLKSSNMTSNCAEYGRACNISIIS
jgi:hypothetical protein